MESYLMHHGIKGQKWGIRRYQNDDGSLTPAGRKRYGNSDAARNYLSKKVAYKTANKEFNKTFNKAYNGLQFGKKANSRWENALDKAGERDAAKKAYKEAKKEYNNTPEGRKNRMKKAAIIGGSIVAAGLAAYGGYKVYSNNKNKKEWANFERRRQEGLKIYNELVKNSLSNMNNPVKTISMTIYDPNGKAHQIGNFKNLRNG